MKNEASKMVTRSSRPTHECNCNSFMLLQIFYSTLYQEYFYNIYHKCYKSIAQKLLIKYPHLLSHSLSYCIHNQIFLCSSTTHGKRRTKLWRQPRHLWRVYAQDQVICKNNEQVKSPSLRMEGLLIHHLNYHHYYYHCILHSL